MIGKTRVMMMVTLVLALAAPAARADSTQTEPVPASFRFDDDRTVEMERAKFSGKRLVLEIIAGEIVGSLVAYGTFSALCDGKDCFGAGIASWVADFAITPVAVWGTGNLFGGQGRLLYSYLGASPALAPFSVTGDPTESPQDTLDRLHWQLTISAILLPICSAAMYEVSSHVASVNWTREHAPTLTVRSTGDATIGMLSLRF